MRDPIEELRSLARDIHSTPLPSAEIRRRGDRDRRRRRIVSAVAAAAVVTLVASGGLAIAGTDTTSAPVAPATDGGAPSGTADARPTADEIPDDFPLTAGLPRPGGDIAPFTWSDKPTEPLRAVACEGDEPLTVDDRRIDSLRVEMRAPDASAWRHLLLFEDEAAAEQAFAEAQSRGANCAEASPADGGDGVSEVRWEQEHRTHGGADDVLTVRGLVYATGTDTRVPGRNVAEVVQVGRALLVAHFDDAASTQGDDREMLLDATVDTLADAMCAFADGCGPAPARVIGPDGLGDLRLGMSRAEIEAAGATVGRGEGCTGFTAPGYRPREGAVDGWVSERYGLVGISARPGVRTPEGIGLGSTASQVAAAYPDAQSAGTGLTYVRVSPGVSYSIGIVDRTVVSLALVLDKQDCFG